MRLLALLKVNRASIASLPPVIDSRCGRAHMLRCSVVAPGPRPARARQRDGPSRGTAGPSSRMSFFTRGLFNPGVSSPRPAILAAGARPLMGPFA